MGDMQVIYLDNAATSWPKPERVYRAADRALRDSSGNPGRSGHRLSLAAGRCLEETRLLLAQLFHIPRPGSLAFTLNTTDALNLALKGVLKPGDQVVTSSMEHNSVARPLEALKAQGVEYTKVRTDPQTGTDPGEVERALRDNTRLVVMTQVSNVTGTENPIGAIGEICRRRDILFLVDAAQSAGCVPLHVEEMHISLLAFPGHKGLLGPQGTGGLYVREGLVLTPLREGGTGSRSEELTQPPSGPDRYESGTPNTPGIAALGEGVRIILEEGVEEIARRETVLTNRLLEGLGEIPGLHLYGPPPGPRRRGVVSLRLDTLESAEAALILDGTFGIAVRAGLHCAPEAHRTLGTLAGGTLRLSPGYATTEAEIDQAIDALGTIARMNV